MEEEQALVVEVWEDPAVVGEEQASAEELVVDLDPAVRVVAVRVVADPGGGGPEVAVRVVDGVAVRVVVVRVVAVRVVAVRVVAVRVVVVLGEVVLVAEPEGVPGKVENQASG